VIVTPKELKQKALKRNEMVNKVISKKKLIEEEK